MASSSSSSAERRIVAPMLDLLKADAERLLADSEVKLSEGFREAVVGLCTFLGKRGCS